MDPVVERNVDLDATPDEVWRALTEPDELATWFGPEVELDVRPGGGGRFVDDDGVARRAVVDEVAPRASAWCCGGGPRATTRRPAPAWSRSWCRPRAPAPAWS